MRVQGNLLSETGTGRPKRARQVLPRQVILLVMIPNFRYLQTPEVKMAFPRVASNLGSEDSIATLNRNYHRMSGMRRHERAYVFSAGRYDELAGLGMQ